MLGFLLYLLLVDFNLKIMTPFAKFNDSYRHILSKNTLYIFLVGGVLYYKVKTEDVVQ